jgi:hypothetical protein
VEFQLPFNSESCVLCFISRNVTINPLNAKLIPICHLLALLGAHLIFHVSRIRVKVLRILILAVVLYGYGTWSLPVREENGLRMCENRVLRNVFWTK